MMTDLANAYLGQTLFIIGGHKSINKMPLDLLEQPGIMTMALNNVPYVFPKPTFWLTADKPRCYGGHFYRRPDIIKFARMDSSLDIPHDATPDELLRTFPNLFFYELAADKYNEENFLTEGADFVWWSSVFPIALQMAWRLGFRRVFLVGCAFTTTCKEPYAWDIRLTDRAKTFNQLCYNKDAAYLSKIKPTLDAAGFDVVSCTPNSQINTTCKFMLLERAVQSVLAGFPEPTPLEKVYHVTALI